MNDSDAELIARVVTRDDHAAFGELVRRHQSAVRRFLRQLNRGDAAWADDLAQESFLHAYRNLHRFRGDSRFLTWVLGIAYNHFRNGRRRKHEAPLAALPEEESVAEDSSVSSDLRQDLTAALTQLSPDEQMAVHVCYHQGLSHQEAADLLACPLGTLKTHLARSKEKLRRLLAAWNPPS